MKINFSSEYIFSTLVALLGIAFVYFFTEIFVYMVIAAILALIGKPLKELLMKIKIGGKTLSETLSSALTIVVMISFFAGILILLIPAIANQGNQINSLDFNKISYDIHSSLQNLEHKLKSTGIIDKNQNIETEIKVYLINFASNIRIGNLANSTVSLAGSLLMGAFSVLFMTFFFIKDEELFRNIVILFVPESKKDKFRAIFMKIREMLSRYFVGLLTEIFSMMVLETVGGFIIGLENALLIGFIGGLLNVIPYIGPLIGASVAAVLVFISHIGLGINAALLPVYGILAVFAIANIIDNFVLQPIIYSNSVKAHPLEIFVVIIVGGNLFGVVGMILAIPVYTIIRIVAREFFYDQDFVKTVTKNL